VTEFLENGEKENEKDLPFHFVFFRRKEKEIPQKPWEDIVGDLLLFKNDPHFSSVFYMHSVSSESLDRPNESVSLQGFLHLSQIKKPKTLSTLYRQKIFEPVTPRETWSFSNIDQRTLVLSHLASCMIHSPGSLYLKRFANDSLTKILETEMTKSLGTLLQICGNSWNEHKRALLVQKLLVGPESFFAPPEKGGFSLSFSSKNGEER